MDRQLAKNKSIALSLSLFSLLIFIAPIKIISAANLELLYPPTDMLSFFFCLASHHFSWGPKICLTMSVEFTGRISKIPSSTTAMFSQDISLRYQRLLHHTFNLCILILSSLCCIFQALHSLCDVRIHPTQCFLNHCRSIFECDYILQWFLENDHSRIV